MIINSGWICHVSEENDVTFVIVIFVENLFILYTREVAWIFAIRLLSKFGEVFKISKYFLCFVWE